jgi:hypothetical protein
MENSNKPAFANMPSYTDPRTSIVDFGGLTKREYFAGLAMQGLLATISVGTDSQMVPNSASIKYMTDLAIDAADELLKALEPK